MELKQIKYFLVLAEELNFGRAAEKLNMSQPPLSKSIKALEDHLKIVLFKRNSKGVSLTTEGKIFLEEAKHLVHQTEEVSKKIKSLKKGYQKVINIGFVYPAIYLFLSDVIKAFKIQYPEIKFRLLEYCVLTDFQEKIINHELDLAFVYTPVNDDRINSQMVHLEDVSVVFPKNHPLAQEKEISIGQLKGEQILIQPKEAFPEIIGIFIYRCETEFNFTPKLDIEATSQQARIEMVAQGLGVTYAGSSLAALYKDKVNFVKLANNETAHVGIAMIWNKSIDKEATKNFKALVNKMTARNMKVA